LGPRRDRNAQSHFDINSAEPESGKSTTMGLIAFLMPKCCLGQVSVKPQSIARLNAGSQYLCFDEFDSILADDTRRRCVR
jgi:hypothetical protein